MASSPSEEVLFNEMGESLDTPLLRLLQSTAPYIAEAFLDAITGRVADLCGARMAYVAELLVDSEKARVVAGTRDNEHLQPFEYRLAGTPGMHTVEEATTIVRDSLPRDYQVQDWLPGIEPESYVSVRLCSSSGDVIGMLAVAHDAPLQHPEFIASLLEAVAPRVAVELERRQRASILRRSESRLRLLTEYCRDILFYYHMPDRRFEFISPAVEEITGYPPEAFQANPELALEIVYDEDRPRVRGAIDQGSSEPIIARIRTLNRETRWIEYRNYAFRDDSGEIVAVCGTIRDVTIRTQVLEDLKESERYRAALLQSMPDTMFRLDADGRMLDYMSGEANRAFPDTTQELVGRNLKEILPLSFMGPIVQLTQAALQTNRLHRTEFDVSSDTKTVTYEARCLPFGKGEVLLILRDFTAVKWHEGEEDRRRLRDELDVKAERRRTNPYMLTYREIAILHLVAEGQADKQIAESLGISTYTVNKHVGNILGKMNASSRTEAGVRSIREGLVG